MPDAYIERTREFFGSRAATWDAKFGHDMPVYAAAITEAGIRRGGVVVDAGCGTGRVTRPGEILILFHPVSRTTLAARHGRTVSPDEILSPAPLRTATTAAGWDLATYDDAPDRFLAVAIRRLPASVTREPWSLGLTYPASVT